MIYHLQASLVTFAAWLRIGEYLGLENCNLIFKKIKIWGFFFFKFPSSSYIFSHRGW